MESSNIVKTFSTMKIDINTKPVHHNVNKKYKKIK